MSTKIDFDFEEEEEQVQADPGHTSSSGSSTYVDAYIPAYGWIPVERLASDTVRVLHDNEVQVNCRTAPLYSRSLRDECDVVRPGQGVLVECEEYEPASLVSPVHGIVESVEIDGIYVRIRGVTMMQVTRQQIRPVSTNVLPSSTAHSYRSEVERQYNESLIARDLSIVPMRGDGNCLFRAVAHQVYGNSEPHGLIRRVCAEYMAIERSYFEPFVTEASGRISGRAPYTGFDQYIQTLKQEGTWGDDPELQALCEIYQRPAEVFFWDVRTKRAEILRRLNEENSELNKTPPIRLSFMGGGHYDSIVNTTAVSSTLSSGAPRPGRLEARALELARSRHAGGVSLATKLSDEMETERAQLEAALAKSRGTQTGGFNMQEALEKSLKSFAEDEKSVLEKARLQSLKEIEEAELKRALKESMASRPAQRHVAVPEEYDDEDVMLRLAIEESLRGS